MTPIAILAAVALRAATAACSADVHPAPVVVERIDVCAGWVQGQRARTVWHEIGHLCEAAQGRGWLDEAAADRFAAKGGA